MKNDINLLFRRRVKNYSSKNILVLLLLLLIVGGVASAAIALPSLSLQSEKTEAARIEDELKASSVDTIELAAKSTRKNNLDMILEELNVLASSKADILKYLEVIESQRPSSLWVRKLDTNDAGRINLGGIADSDKTIALFCLNLREQKNEQGQRIFKEVLLISSITDLTNNMTSYGIIITLPSPLSSTDIIQEIEKKDDVTTTIPAPGGNK